MFKQMKLKLCTVPFLISLLAASAVYSQSVNPLEGSSRAAYAGGALFRAQCATCHGADARGIESIEAPDLTQMWLARQLTDADVFATIRDGIPGTIMPPHDFTETEVWMLVSYLRSIAVSGVSNLPAGDTDNGAQLFATHCAECHRVGRSGGTLGPELSGILGRRSLQYIESAIRSPHSQIASGFSRVIVETDTGNRHEGVLKNEDAFSLQMLDLDQKLLGFNKSELRNIRMPDNSLMPVFDANMLSRSEMLDILNFIRTVNNGDGL